MIALVAAMDEARLVGVSGRLPWHIPADLAHFRALTMGHVVVMGRRTWESLPGPLADREEWVVTTRHLPGVRTMSLRVMETFLSMWRGDAFIIGGASVYAAALPLADRLYLTRIRHTFPAGDGAVYFPEWRGFRLTDSKHREADAANPYLMEFQTWTRE